MIHVGDCLDILPTLPEQSVQTCVTSPPYFGLRDYGTAQWEGGDEACDHVQTVKTGEKNTLWPNGFLPPGNAAFVNKTQQYRHTCGKCGAIRTDSQIGLEPTPGEYVEQLVRVFREVRRVLRDDGTVWLNLGDSYAGAGPSGASYQSKTTIERAGKKRDGSFAISRTLQDRGLTYAEKKPIPPPGLKPKDLIGIPWRVAFALQADGWCLRQEIIWAKPNPMPESVRDRCTKSHEHIFLFAKARWSGAVSPIVCSDVDAAWLAAIIDGEGSIGIGGTSSGGHQCHIHVANTCRAILERIVAITGLGRIGDSGKGTNRPVFRWQVTGPQAASVLYRIRSYLIAKQRQADNALELQESQRRYGGKQKPDTMQKFQAALHERGKALNKGHDIEVRSNGASWRGGAYYFDAEAIKEQGVTNDPRRPYGSKGANELDPRGEQGAGRLRAPANVAKGGFGGKTSGTDQPAFRSFTEERNKRSVWTVTTKPFTGAHFATFPEDLIEPCILAGSRPGDVVLDPFMGAGTTAVVAERFGRQWIGCELNPEYAAIAERRVRGVSMGLPLEFAQ